MQTTLAVNPARIYQARLAAALSRMALAHRIWQVSGEEIRASEASVRRWEKGISRPRDGVVPAIALATGRPLDFFYSTDDSPDDAEGGEEPG